MPRCWLGFAVYKGGNLPMSHHVTLCVQTSLDSSKFFHFLTEKNFSIFPLNLLTFWIFRSAFLVVCPELWIILLAKVNIWEGGWAPTTLFIFRKGGYPLYIYRQCNYFENQYYEKKNLEGSPILIDPHLGSLNHFHSFIHFITYSFIFQRPTTYWQVLGFRLCVLFHATKLKLGLKSNLYFPDSFSLFYFKTVIWNPISLTS